jgi:hypothetical protein
MNLAALTLMLAGATLSQTPTPEPTPQFHNLDFCTATLQGWEGSGFYITNADPRGPNREWGVCSSDGETPGRKGLLRRVFTVPPGAGFIRFEAYASYGKACPPNDSLDVMLLAAGRKVVPKKVLAADGWVASSKLRTKPREYMWDITNYVGQKLQIVIMDQDERPGYHVYCSGFRYTRRDDFDGAEFAKFMLKLEDEHKLPPLQRYESKHFMALSNADEEFTVMRIRNCELIYSMFLDHFYRRGFQVREPGYKMMVAVFDAQTGFEAYIGQRVPATIVGVYHLPTNRLVIYDINRNNLILARREIIKARSRNIFSDLDRMRFVETEGRKTREVCTDVNISTTMHEVAHQLSFNTGLLNREGDVPLWLAEGLACYCESTRDGAWQGPGEPNPDRTVTLARVLAGRYKYVPLEDLVSSNAWLHEPHLIAAGYAQSWALFRMLMEERPEAFRKYLAKVYTRRTDGTRLNDFREAFGQDLQRFELRFQEYIREVVHAHPPREPR